MKVGIVGMGWVGSSVAISTLHSGVATELRLNDVKPGLAEGEAMDLLHGAAFFPAANVLAASWAEMKTMDVVVFSAGRGGRPGETRLDLLRENAEIARQFGEAMRGFRGIIVVVSNPVDILTAIITDASRLDPARVMGTGTMLDTARLRQVLGRDLNLNPRSIHAQVVGEHGDSEVVLWSGARIGGTALQDWPGWCTSMKDRMAAEVRTAAQEIIVRKGATNHAIGLVTAALLRWILRGERRVLTVSRLHHGPLGLADVALSLPVVVGPEGATEVIVPEMNRDEKAALLRSADVLTNAARDLR